MREKQMTILGREVTVKDWIPYKEKLEWAEEFVGRAAIFDEDNGVLKWSHLKAAIAKYIFLRAYTNLDMTDYDGIDGLCQLMDENDRCEFAEIEKFIDVNDRMTIVDLAEKLYESVKISYEKSMSLEQKIKTSLGFLLDGKDLTETMAEARDVNEQMIDHLGAIMRQKPIDMAQYAKKKKK